MCHLFTRFCENVESSFRVILQTNKLTNQRRWKHNLLGGSNNEVECSESSYLAPDEHAAEDNLKTVEEVVADDDDRRAAGRPSFIRTDCFNRRRCSTQETCPVRETHRPLYICRSTWSSLTLLLVDRSRGDSPAGEVTTSAVRKRRHWSKSSHVTDNTKYQLPKISGNSFGKKLT